MTLNPVVIITMAAIQNQSSSSNPSALEIATRTHTSLFRWYLVWLVIAAFISATFTWLVWRSGNRQQYAAIAETKERTAKLEKEAADARLELAKIDPLNLPIKSMRVDIFLLIRGVFDSSFSIDPKPSPKLANFVLSTREGVILGLSSQQLECEATFATQNDTDDRAVPNARRISLSCFWPGNELIDAQISALGDKGRYWIDRENVSTTRLDKESYCGVLYLFGVTDESEIISGSCTIVINGAIRRTLSVPKKIENRRIIFNPIKESSLEGNTNRP